VEYLGNGALDLKLFTKEAIFKPFLKIIDKNVLRKVKYVVKITDFCENIRYFCQVLLRNFRFNPNCNTVDSATIMFFNTKKIPMG
jgi:hypothetical protein